MIVSVRIYEVRFVLLIRLIGGDWAWSGAWPSAWIACTVDLQRSVSLRQLESDGNASRSGVADIKEDFRIAADKYAMNLPVKSRLTLMFEILGTVGRSCMKFMLVIN
ncbi:unnamed protein product [Protopolystoma xenopodis]|uniref:Uncharacterized protein n=1 Tax=Protopolystoma xenopodis TaxID=117903 RepID=A0A448XRA9_9PLAT|nr:unnamed protein product [Protopolystoma xenopodis]